MLSAFDITGAIENESNQIPELNEQNNHNCRMFGVDLQPSKLPFYSGNSPINRLNILKGETVQLFAKVLNNGTFRANNAKVSFVFNNQILQMDVIPFINGGSSAEATILHAFNQTGDFTIQIITDYENEVAEADETNNVVNLFVSVYNDLPDLFIASEHIAPGSINPIQNELIDVNATYFNLGNVPSGSFTVTLYADDEFITDTIVGSVEPGEEASVGWQNIYSSDVPGIHILKVVLDENSQMDEVNELNNVATRVIIVGDAPDFLLADVILSKIYPAIGEQIEITASITNAGDAGAEAMLSVFYIAMNDTIQIYSEAFFLSKHGTTEETVQWNAQVEEGYILTVITCSNPPEVNLANNSVVRYFGDEIKVINPIGDVEVYEDTPKFEIEDLVQVFENVDQTMMTFTFETGDPDIYLEISADNKLEMSLAANWFGNTFAIIKAHNIYNQQASDTLWIAVNSYPAEHHIQIPKGWSGLSSWVLPHNPQIENVFTPVADKLIILQTMNSMYYPSQTINTIGSWESQSAFKIKVTEDCTLRISGYDDLNKDFDMAIGWNLVPIVCNQPVVAIELFSVLYSGLIIAKDIAGSGVYWPEFGVNSLGSLQPGKAYFVKMRNAGTITFPENDFTGFKTLDLPSAPDNQSPWGLVNNSPSSHIIAIPASVSQEFSQNSFIGAFTTEGICAGYCSINAQSQVLVVNNDDPLTSENDGFEVGEPLSFRIWDSGTGNDAPLKVQFNPGQPDHSGVFVADGISAISDIQILNNTPEQFLNGIKVYPNPAHDFVNIAGIAEGTVLQITVFTQTGQRVMSQTLTTNCQIDFRNFPAGIYLLKMDDGQNLKFEKVVIE